MKCEGFGEAACENEGATPSVVMGHRTTRQPYHYVTLCPACQERLRQEAIHVLENEPPAVALEDLADDALANEEETPPPETLENAGDGPTLVEEDPPPESLELVGLPGIEEMRLSIDAGGIYHPPLYHPPPEPAIPQAPPEPPAAAEASAASEPEDEPA
jgi:hypothetical protein